MTIFVATVLIRLAGQAPYECARETAQDVIEAEPAGDEMMCGFYGQGALAGTSIGRSLRKGAWVKIARERSRR